MSPFLYHVSQLVDQFTWVEPNLFCAARHGAQTIAFVATDDGWYGTLTAQHPMVFDDDQFARVDELLRRVDFDSEFLTVELHEKAAIVRCVLRLPIYNEPRWDDDAAAVVGSLVHGWGVLEPLIVRAARGEELRIVTAEAQVALATLPGRQHVFSSPTHVRSGA